MGVVCGILAALHPVSPIHKGRLSFTVCYRHSSDLDGPGLPMQARTFIHDYWRSFSTLWGSELAWDNIAVLDCTRI
jgi:hypothetical protein